MEVSHTFAICAYKESAYLEECIQSIRKQSLKTNIIMITSTENDFLKGISDKFEIPLYINRGERGITQDWNFAYQKANTDYVTIAHQDDVYFKDYAKYVVRYLEKQGDALIYFTDYAEIRDNKIIRSNKLLRIKRLMLYPLRFSMFWGSRFVRRRILSFGSPICCPSVTLVKKNLPSIIWEKGFRSNEDWEAWEKISKMRGKFIYNREILVGHRIHEGSETSMIIKDGARTQEDYIMFRKFWPSFIAKILTRLYAKSEESNQI